MRGCVKRDSSFVFVAAIVLALSSATLRLEAQSLQNGNIRGKVTDATGGALPGVTITAASPSLLVAQVVTTSGADGDYAFPDLPIGVYRVTYELAGFQRLVREDIQLSANFSAAINVTLKIGAVEESITVSGQSPVVDTTATTPSVSLSGKVITEVIPAVRTLTEFVSTTPGVVPRQRHDLGGVVAGPNFGAYGFNDQLTVLYDGVNTRQGSTNPGVAPDLGTLEEMQIVTIGGTAEQALPGVAVNMVVKSGGNSFHGRYEAQGEHSRFQGDNLSDALKAQGVTSGDATLHNAELSGDLGGRVIRDRLWFYAAGRYQDSSTTALGFSKARGADGIYGTADDVPGERPSIFNNRTLKTTYQASQHYKVIGFYQLQKQDVPVYNPSRTIPFEATQHFTHDPHQFKAELQAMPSSRLLFDFNMGYHHYNGVYTAQEGFDNVPTTRDQTTTINEGPSLDQTQRPRQNIQPVGSVSYFPSASLLGKHELKGGFSFYRQYTGNGNLAGRHGNYRLIFDTIGGVAHQPSQIITYNYPVTPRDRMHEGGIYAQDQWRVADRLTFNVGLRWDNFHTWIPEQTKEQGQFSTAGSYPSMETGTWRSFAPRIGGAWTATKDGKTVLKATWGRYNHTPGDDFGEAYNLNGPVSTTYRWTDPNGNGDYDPGEVNLATNNNPAFITISSAANNIFNPDLRMTFSRQATLTLDREVMANFAARFSYIYFRQLDIYTDVNVLRPYSAWSVPIQRQDPGPDGNLGTADDGGMFTVYDYTSAYAGARFVGNERVNAAHDREPVRHGLEAVFTRRTTGKWGMLGSFSAQKVHRYITPTPASPNDDLFNVDNTWDWQSKFTGSYELPRAISVAATYQVYNGIKGQRTYIFRNIPTATQVTLRLEEYGATTAPVRSLLNLRFAKDMRMAALGAGRLRASVELMNMTNSSAPWARSYASGPTFGQYTSIDGPRIVRGSLSFIF